MLFVADSESSTIRVVSCKDGSVKALVGGALDPQVRNIDVIIIIIVMKLIMYGIIARKFLFSYFVWLHHLSLLH